jgi:hypothetical protein
MKFLLDKNQLKGLSPEEQKDVEDKALSTFLMGSIFGGQGISSGYKAVQDLVPNLQKQKQQQGLLAELAGIQRDVFPTQQQQQQAQSETINTYLGREKTASSPYALTESLGAPQERVEPQYTNQPVNLDAAYSRLGRLATNPAGAQLVPALSSILKDIRPEYVDGVRVNRNTGEIMGALPKVDVKTGTVTRGTVQNGQLQFQTDVLQGAKRAAALNTLPELDKGQEYLFDANQNVVGIRDAAGAIQSIVARQSAETGAREANIPREITTSSGAKAFTFVTPPSMRQQGGATQGATGQNVAGQGAPMQGGGGGGGVQGGSLTTAQAALNASYEPILKDAYQGYKVASQRSGTLQQLQTALNNPNFDTNAFAPAKTAITSFLTASGVTGDNAKQYLTSAASMRQGLNTLASQSVSELPGAISNFEIGFAQNRFGTITDPKDSNKYAIALMQEADARKKQFYEFVSNPRNAGPDVIQKWENSPQGRRSLFEAPALRKYLPQAPVTSGRDKGKIAYQMPDGKYRVYD